MNVRIPQQRTAEGRKPGFEVEILPAYEPDVPCQCRWYRPTSGKYEECGRPSCVRLRIDCAAGHSYTTFNCQSCYDTWRISGNVTCRDCNAPLDGWNAT